VVAGIPGATLDRLGKLASAFEEGPGLLAGIASFPETAHSADELVEVARRHCFRATASAPVRGGRTDTTSDDSGGVVLASSRMRELMAQVERVAPSKACVLVIGETGSGKEVVARAIHAQSPRKNRAFRAVNCGAIPENLVEATLFGHERGAFTGADRRAAGAFEQADQGTLFLDEIGELGLSAQAALLRVLETGTITPLGSASERKVDVRVVAATHRDLEALTRRGDFREDLMFRLDVLRLDVPPLRERAEDIEALAIHFLDRSNQDGTAEARSLSPEALAVLKTYAWPGNVRELRNAIERAALLATSDVIAVTDLPARVRGSRLPHQARSADLDSDDDLIYKERVRRFETDLITEALDACDWNQTEAAKRLKIPIRTLTDKMRQLGLRSRRKE
jgi:DNA-binding NtrC family response regulator